MSPSRIILFPHAHVWSVEAERDVLFRLLIVLGGDVSRVFEPGTRTLDRFIPYLKRTPWPLVLGFADFPIVVLTETFPLPAATTQLRERITEQLPFFSRSLWVIWYDGRRDTAFREAAEKMGRFDEAELDQFPVWETGEQRYLLATPMSLDLATALAKLPRLLPRRKPSGTMPAV